MLCKGTTEGSGDVPNYLSPTWNLIPAKQYIFFKQSNSTHVLVSQLMIPMYLFFLLLEADLKYISVQHKAWEVQKSDLWNNTFFFLLNLPLNLPYVPVLPIFFAFWLPDVE